MGGALVAGDVEVVGDRIGAFGLAPAGSGLAAPGFVDVQVNGFVGVDFRDADLAGYRRASLAIARSGVTAFLATLPTASPDAYGPALAVAAAAAREGLPGARLAGVHLEGPFLATARAGAHPRAWLRAPDVGLADAWLAAAPVALMTLAPELPGALALIAHLRARGVQVALGHSDADAETAHRAFDAGARALTHAWNAHRPIRARDPGVGGVALARPDVFVCAIADGVHVAAETLAFTAAAARGRIVLVTDAVAAAGLAEGRHRFGEAEVTLAGGAVRLDDGTLAGSACGMDRALVHLISAGVEPADALDAATVAPARLLGRPALGRLVRGGPADLVVLDAERRVCRVLVAGREV